MAELTDDRVEELFTDLRATQLHLVRPPGATVARVTVRRRRRTTSVAATLAVLAVTGTAFAVTRTGLAADHAAVGGRRELLALSDRAERALPRQSGQNSPIGERWTVIRATQGIDPTGPTHEVDQSLPYDVQPGTYSIDLSCAGHGTAQVRVVSLPPMPGRRPNDDPKPDNERATIIDTVEVTCAEEPGLRSVTVPHVTDGYLRIEARSHPDLKVPAVLAYMITREHLSSPEGGRNLRSAYEALAAANPQVPTDKWMVQYDPPGTMAIADSSGGRRTAQVVCVGTGVVTVVMVDDDHVETPIRNPITCDMTARVHTIAVPPVKAAMNIKAEMDAVARERAGYALVFPRVTG